MTSIFDIIWNGFKTVLFNTLPVTGEVIDTFTDTVSGLTSIYNSIIEIPDKIFGIIMDVFQIIFYPTFCIVDTFYGLMVYVWFVFASLLNVIIMVPNTGFNIYNLFFALWFPSIWAALFFISILINCSIRIYSGVRHVVSWIPFANIGSR